MARLFGLGAVLVAGVVCAACSPPSDSAGDASNQGAGRGALGFLPSNIAEADLGSLPMADARDIVVARDCDVFTDGVGGATHCDKTFQPMPLVRIPQPGGPDLAVLVVKSLLIEASGTLELAGKLPLVIVSLSTVEVRGRIMTFKEQYSGVGGGYGGESSLKGASSGPGGGAWGTDDKSGAGGGAYCGAGGKGTGSGAGAGGTPYGNARLVPLLGGSAGGFASPGGAPGGGAVSIVAKDSIVIAANGLIHAAGAGGDPTRGGGGSGGAILLEAPSVTVAGALAANGGAGYSSYEPEHGRLNGDAARGATYDGATAGDGSSSSRDDGGDATGQRIHTDGGAGGGGGAGRIRINTSTGQANVSGIISPAPGRCATFGMLLEG